MKNVYSVSQVNAYLRNMFSQDFLLRSLYVRGEVSNCKYHSSGHIYFTIKDEKGQIACVMFAGSRKGLKFRLQEGLKVIVFGSIEVYERDGKYQLYAKEIHLDGAGDLYVAYERLKQSLAERGLFSEEYKRPIPKYIRTLGVVTAPTGAAVRDIIHVSRRRNPYVRILLYPAVVQGEQAADSIVEGIRALEREGVDVIIVGRGGGSIEDLWAFNEEKVAQAVFDCSVPVISAVGHETDTTIIDYVADLRAPTPSAAAELAVYEYGQLTALLDGYRDRLDRGMGERLERARQRLREKEARLKMSGPANQLKEKRMHLLRLEERLEDRMKKAVSDKRALLALYAERMNGLSPAGRLSRGYAHVEDPEGRPVLDASGLRSGDELVLYMKDARIEAGVHRVLPWKQEGYGEKEDGYVGS